MSDLPKKRGRPKDSDRRARILAKARELFLENGFQAVSVDSIAAAAEVSNRTVFSHFPTKEELLWAIIREEGEAMRPVFPEHLPKSAEEFRDGLVAWGKSLITLLTTPHIIQLGNLILSESKRHPEMARAFYQWGPQATRRALAKWIAHGKQLGWLSEATPEHAGDHLIALWQGCWHLPQQLGLEERLSRRRIDAHVLECIDLFMRSYLPKP
jgi:TetR/AcrR family transcriptional repressor of mexJK operon